MILVTGGTGTLGRVVVSRLVAAGSGVRVLSRRPRSPADNQAAAWALGDLRRDQGLDGALADVSAVIHCATSRGDAKSAAHLIAAARRNASPHLVFISIVGVDKVPFAYYRSKLATEQLIETSLLPWSIVRTTQFHDLIFRGCKALARPPVMVLPAGLVFQPIEVREVAERLVELAQAPPAGRAPDMGGPELRTVRDLASSYLQAAGRRRTVVSVRLPGSTSAAFRRGDNVTPDRAVGKVTFEEYLAEKFRP